jgi:hypothetical protein
MRAWAYLLLIGSLTTLVADLAAPGYMKFWQPPTEWTSAITRRFQPEQWRECITDKHPTKVMTHNDMAWLQSNRKASPQQIVDRLGVPACQLASGVNRWVDSNGDLVDVRINDGTIQYRITR